ncbi:MAG: tRNA 2-thiouridine(34) synthase MnmA [Gammaproteobacteria bacterium]|nr:MAG: tRNA 2-thiouridine(34) synthase MnmA [Gammaproteobacteria bacterium]
MSERVIVGLSGGVDSAVAALLLKDAGHDVQGLFMSNWEEDDDGYCTAAQDYQDARAVAAELGIALHRASFARQYREQVFGEFLREHRAGRTPNPDVLCNREIKFGVALEWAQRLGASHFATGHYARLEPSPEGGALYKARDDAKDQSYFLHAVSRAQLSRTLMPLGELEKSAVRERARRSGLPVFDKPDSTGICFIGERPFRAFLTRFLPVTPGPIESPSGERLGTHQGLAFHTLGQRGGHDHPLLSSEALATGAWHWLASPRRQPFRCGVKVRYRQADEPALLEPRSDGTVRVRFERPQRAVTPGQYAVAYEGERCLGGAVIESIEPRVRESAAA